MDSFVVFAASAGIGQILTDCFEPSTYQSTHAVGACNRLNVRFETQGALPEWIDWKLETSSDGGVTWRGGPATVLWGGTRTLSPQMSMRPGTSVSSVEVPRNSCVRLLARRRGGGSDTTVLGVGSFEDVAPKRHRSGETIEPRRPRQRVDMWGRPVSTPEDRGGKRSY